MVFMLQWKRAGGRLFIVAGVKECCGEGGSENEKAPDGLVDLMASKEGLVKGMTQENFEKEVHGI